MHITGEREGERIYLPRTYNITTAKMHKPREKVLKLKKTAFVLSCNWR